MNKIVRVSGLLLGCLVASVFADAPVVDHSVGAVADSAQTFSMVPTVEPRPPVILAKPNLNSDQRISRLEQQVNYVNGQNLAGKIEELQQKLQQVTGELEAKNHQIEELSKQLKDFYQDLNQRLGNTKPELMPQGIKAAEVPVATTAGVANAPEVPNASVVPATAGNIAGVFASAPPVPAKTNSDSAFLKEQQAYQTALDLLPEKKHESENKLRSYLQQYPKGIYAANAHYWLGEINFLQKNFDAAEEEFKLVISKYPKSKRIADAKLKLALVHQNQGRDDIAKQELQTVIKSYPGTTAAQLAKQQLATH